MDSRLRRPADPDPTKVPTMNALRVPQSSDLAGALTAVRERAPLVQNITNYVVMNTTANALLAVGASPAMIHAPEEAGDFARISNALVINIGTLSAPWVRGMRAAVSAAADRSVPWVLDPVGAGATPYRTDVARELAALRPSVIRANASEVAVLAGQLVGGRGVDSLHSPEAVSDAAATLARTCECVVAMTGEVDYITDGVRTLRIRNGDVLLSRVTGMGCTASALVGAFLGAGHDSFLAAAAAVALLAVAGEDAAAAASGPGSLQVQVLDTLYHMTPAAMAARLRLE
jgi:hydroxyethylthiazole kinase